MLSICIETSGAAVSVAVGGTASARGSGPGPGFVLGSVQIGEGRRHAESLMPSIDLLMRSLERTRDDITHVAVDIGPGLFTGLRVGVSTAKGLALALRLPIVAFTSLELLARAVLEPDDAGVVAIQTASTPRIDSVTCALDARRGEIYTATYSISAAGDFTETTPPELVAANQWQPNGPVVGDAHLRAVTIAASPGATVMATALGRMAVAGSLTSRCQEPAAIDLLYLRASDAELLAAGSK